MRKLSIYILRRPVHLIGYDEMGNFVIAASCETEARKFANGRHGDEGAIWENKSRVQCEKVGQALDHVEPSILVSDFWAG